MKNTTGKPRKVPFMTDTLPVSDKITPRPVWARQQRRRRGEPVGPITEEEKRDAIRVLEEHDEIGTPTALSLEAFRILDEAGR